VDFSIDAMPGEEVLEGEGRGEQQQLQLRLQYRWGHRLQLFVWLCGNFATTHYYDHVILSSNATRGWRELRRQHLVDLDCRVVGARV
jgi:hypothetical protein